MNWAVFVSGLKSPDGLVREPESGDYFVSEEEAATILRIRPDGHRTVLFDRSTPIYDETVKPRRKVDGLRSPEGLALDRNGRLYAVEDIPGGRLLSFNIRSPAVDQYPSGRVEPIPGEPSRYAWESVAIGPAGDLLLAGSTMESFLNEPNMAGLVGLFRGTILYRDANGDWWVPLDAPMASFSAVSFAPDGRHAFYACEIPGDVGCLDLQTRQLRTYQAERTLHSPEGLCALPDGTALVLEETGKIYHLDPYRDALKLVMDSRHVTESILWDPQRQRVLVTADQRGALLELEPPAGLSLAPPGGAPPGILFQAQFTSVEMIPEKCPGYLRHVLKLGGYDPEQAGADLAFQEFARKYCLVAVDADTLLISRDQTVQDPIQHVQFIIVAPYLIGSQGGRLVWSSSGFAARKASGQVVKTSMVKRAAIRGDLMEMSFFPMGGQLIALPMPFSSQIDTDGIASIHFLGMGVTPDYLFLLNTTTPDQSFMLVMQLGEKPQLYSVSLPANQDNRHWVIALEQKKPEVWRRLAPAE